MDAAVELFSHEPWDFVTVADIVERAGMTPATFYYHFSSRDELLEEIIQDFAGQWIATVTQLLETAETADALCDVPLALLDELDAAGPGARVFFLHTAKEPLPVQRIRTDARTQLIRAAARAVRRIFPDRDSATANVNGVAMVMLNEMAARCRLEVDGPYRTLGARRFRGELTRLSRVSAGVVAGAQS